jgi:hypothetical protein
MHIDPTLSEWLNLALRWTHVFAGIMWVGTTYYFTWLDARLTEEEKAAANTGNVAQVLDGFKVGASMLSSGARCPDIVSRTTSLVQMGSRNNLAKWFRLSGARVLHRWRCAIDRGRA